MTPQQQLLACNEIDEDMRRQIAELACKVHDHIVGTPLSIGITSLIGAAGTQLSMQLEQHQDENLKVAIEMIHDITFLMRKFYLLEMSKALADKNVPIEQAAKTILTWEEHQ